MCIVSMMAHVILFFFSQYSFFWKPALFSNCSQELDLVSLRLQFSYFYYPSFDGDHPNGVD